ncbi:MAG: flagellar hook capping FlgD N-terminal domain-containing protein [Phycisphaerales bacterium JB065]
MSAISGSTGSSSNAPASSTDAFSAMSSVDFLEIIFSELTNQDPLAPNETKDLLEQISTIRAIESDLSLAEELQTMVRQNEITSSSSLVGKFITGKTSSNTEVAGFVDSVSITREGIKLNLSTGYTVDLDAVDEIIDPDIIAIGDPDDDGDVEEPDGDDDDLAEDDKVEDE